jgi:hypothetical protein
MEILIHLWKEMSPNNLGWLEIPLEIGFLQYLYITKTVIWNTVRTREMDLPLREESERVQEDHSRETIAKDRFWRMRGQTFVGYYGPISSMGQINGRERIRILPKYPQRCDTSTRPEGGTDQFSNGIILFEWEGPEEEPEILSSTRV